MKKSTYLAFGVILGVLLLAFMAPILFFHHVERSQPSNQYIAYEPAGVNETHKFGDIERIYISWDDDEFYWRREAPYITVCEGDVDSLTYTADAKWFRNMTVTTRDNTLTINVTSADLSKFQADHDDVYVNLDAVDNMGVILVPRGSIRKLSGSVQWYLHDLTGDSLEVDRKHENVTMENCQVKKIVI